MTTRISTDTVPSLRQHMINEALDYHQNMNSVVFARTAQSVAFNNNPSGKTDPSQGDIMIDGTIKQKISDILSAIQKLNQSITYITPSPLSGSSKPKRGKKENMLDYIERVRQYNEYLHVADDIIDEYNARTGQAIPHDLIRDDLASQVRDGLVNPTVENIKHLVRLNSVKPQPPDRQTYREEGKTEYPDIPAAYQQVPRHEPTGAFLYQRPERQEQTGETGDIVLYPQSERPPTEQRLMLEDYQPFPYVGPESHYGPLTTFTPQTASATTSSSGPPQTASATPQTGMLPTTASVTHPSYSEPPAAGPLAVVSPPSELSSKLKIQIDTSLASIVSSYNSLISFIELQQRQRLFKSREEQQTAEHLKELLSPLKLLIANSTALKNTNGVKGLQDYTRVYNVLSDLVRKIELSPPFFKVDPLLLTEDLPIRKDLLFTSDFDAVERDNHEYLKSLSDKLYSANIQMQKFNPKSKLEQESRELKMKEISRIQAVLNSSGFKLSKDHISKLDEEISKIESDIDTLREGEEASEAFVIGETLQRDRYAQTQDAQRDLSNILRSLDDRTIQINETRAEFDALAADVTASKEQFSHLKREATMLKDIIRTTPTMSTLKLQVIERYKQNVEESSALTYSHKNLVREKNRAASRLNSMVRDQQQGIVIKRTLEEYIQGSEQERVRLGQELEHYKELSERASKLGTTVQELSDKRGQKILNKVYHEKNLPLEEKELEKRELESITAQPDSVSLPTGYGKPRRTGGHVHKASADPFGDNNKLEPYLTKYLRPSKFRNNVPAIESSSDESSDGENDEPQKVPRPTGGKRGKKKAVEDWEIIETSIHPDKAVLVEKKLKSKRIGSGKKLETTKPAHTMRAEQDLWFM